MAQISLIIILVNFTLGKETVAECFVETSLEEMAGTSIIDMNTLGEDLETFSDANLLVAFYEPSMWINVFESCIAIIDEE